MTRNSIFPRVCVNNHKYVPYNIVVILEAGTVVNFRGWDSLFLEHGDVSPSENKITQNY